MEEAEPENVALNPVATELREGALHPYERVLPPSVLLAFGNLLDMILEAHPIGSDILARLSPGLSAAPDVAESASAKGFRAFALVSVLKKTLTHIRDTAPHEERARFFWCPEGSFQVLAAFLGYFCASDSASALSDREARTFAQEFADAIVSALFLGLIRNIEDHPTLPLDWGDTGKELTAQAPVTRVLLRDALGRLSARERAFLSHYHACGWAADGMEKRLQMSAPSVHSRCIEVLLHLGAALRARLDRGVLSTEKPS
jgi:DNA-directed RNA polymerase specialized sigma24 family protein